MKQKNNRKPKILNEIDKVTNDKFKKMSKILDKKINYSVAFNKQKNELIISNDKEKVLTAEYNFYGIIRPDGRFLWAYMIPGVDKRLLPKINKIKSFSYLFEDSDDKTMMFYHQILTQDSILLNEDEIILLKNLILFLSEDLYYLNSINSSQNLQLLYLSEIKERYM